MYSRNVVYVSIVSFRISYTFRILSYIFNNLLYKHHEQCYAMCRNLNKNGCRKFERWGCQKLNKIVDKNVKKCN